MTGKLGAGGAPEQNIIAAFKFVGRRIKLSEPSESSSEVEGGTAEDWEWFKLDTLKHFV